MRIAVVGHAGQLGVDLCEAFRARQHVVFPLAHKDLEVRDAKQVERVLCELAPEVVVNTAAFHKVEQCEMDPTLSFAVNAVGPRYLALTCVKLDAVLVHFSTDYVFSGEKASPYLETDLPRPLNVYGASKLAGEAMVALACWKHIIIRTCGLYGLAGSSGKGGNFVETMLRKMSQGEAIRVVDDQVLTPTFTADVASAVTELLQARSYGLYHVSAAGECSWFQFAAKIFELVGADADLSAVKTTAFSSLATRPPYSVLDKRKLESLGIRIPDWVDGLGRYLAARRARGGN